MKKGRSTYIFQLNCDPNVVNNLIQSYIQTNGFILQNKDGEQFYRAGDAMIEGYRYFNYSISGQTLTIYAWLKGILGEVTLEQNAINMPAMNFRNSLNTLFQEIGKLNNNVSNIQENVEILDVQNIAQNNTSKPMQNNVNNFAQTFKNETTKKQETMCEIGFWISLFGVLCALLGVTYGIIIYIMDFYFASQGLKTRKKGKAIATIVLSIVSIVIVIIKLIAMS